MALECRGHDHAGTEGQHAGRGDLGAAVAAVDVDGLRWRCIGIAGVDRHGIAVDLLRVVARHVDHVGLRLLDGDELLRRLDDERARIGALRIGRGRVVGRCRGGGDLDLVVVLEPAGLGGALAHDLDRVHHVGRVVVVGLAQCLGPGQVAGHLVHHVAEGGQRLHARVPGLLVDGIGQRAGLERGVLLEPVLRGGDLLGIGGAGQHLRHELVGVQRDGRDHLVELLGRGWHIGHGHGSRGCRSCGGGYRSRCLWRGCRGVLRGGRLGLVAAREHQCCGAQRERERTREGGVGGDHVGLPGTLSWRPPVENGCRN